LDTASSKPSTASGVTAEDVAASAHAGPFWLIEQHRTPIVTHYSYTMNHPTPKNDKANSIITFAHFAYLHSNRNMVFADLQGIICSDLLSVV